MDIRNLMELSRSEVRNQYEIYLKSRISNENTVYSLKYGTFYLWVNGSKELFWSVVTLPEREFEITARKELGILFERKIEKGTSNRISGKISCLKKFREFIADYTGETIIKIEEPTPVSQKTMISPMKTSVNIPTPSKEEVEFYLEEWRNLENYFAQEKALDKLFHTLCPKNTELEDILIKVATLNDFYSTNIYSVYPVAQHILSLNIDDGLDCGDVSLVESIQKVQFGDSEKKLYSFATKYCSHHNPNAYPIYDSYVEKVLKYFRDKDRFAQFSNKELKDYICFKSIVLQFRRFYGLQCFELKEIDKYLWRLGKNFFSKDEK